jgi:hypothetical protein
MRRVPTCDTLHALIRDHRERAGTPLNQEVRIMMQITPDYEALSVIQVRSACQCFRCTVVRSLSQAAPH